MVTLEASTYRDINLDSPLPVITESSVATYLHVLDAKVTKIAKDQYNERYLSYCRYAPGHAGTTLFVRAKCQAQMKSGVSYIVDVKLDNDGMVCTTQCECAAGMGPVAHCKHVSAVLYGFTVYVTEGGLKAIETCTQTQQQFHAVKRAHGGSPIKASNLKLPFGNQTVYDPRPVERRNVANYQHVFSNNWKACPRVGERPVSHLLEPGNVRAVVNDHTYCTQSIQDCCLTALNVLFINNADREEVEHQTRGQGSSKHWAFERTKRLQSSNFGRICKLTERTGASVYAKSLTELVPQIKVPSILHSNRYEAVALKKFAEHVGKSTSKCGIHVCADFPFLGGSPDALLVELDGSVSVVEVKCPYSARDQAISCKTVPYLEERDGNVQLKCNHDYFFQIQGQMLCVGAEMAYFIVYSFKDMLTLKIARDNEFIKIMVGRLQAFFDNHFKHALLEVHLFRTFADADKSCTESDENNLL